MSDYCFGSLTTSQREEECEPLWNGHCGLFLALVVGLSWPSYKMLQWVGVDQYKVLPVIPSEECVAH